MKLLTRTTIMYVGITLVVFTFGSWLFYSFLTDLVEEEATEALVAKKEVVAAALTKDSLPLSSSITNDVSIKETSGIFSDRLTDTFMLDPFADEELPYRVLTFHLEKQERHYAVSIRNAVLESDDLIEGVFTSFILVLGLLAIGIIVSMQLLSRRIWKPFMTTLSSMHEFHPGSKNEISLPQSRITEFQQLNTAIEKMTANTESAFQSLKSFSENAAHEIQTPLAIIQSTTEVLLQDEKLTEEQHKTLSQLSSTTARLSNIVSTLLLLTRIENKQFLQETPIDFSEVVESKMELFRELFDQRCIKLEIEIEKNVSVKLHRALAEIVVSNLLVNAVRHTADGGTATIRLSQKQFAVMNSGLPLKGDSTRLFDRFYKEDQSEHSTGLGLSLVKMAADTSGMKVIYSFSDQNHVFTFEF